MEKKVKLPLSDDEIMDINAGDKLYLTGYIYTARDAAHKKMVETMENGDKLPFNIKGCLLYTSPSPRDCS